VERNNKRFKCQKITIRSRDERKEREMRGEINRKLNMKEAHGIDMIVFL